MHGTDEELAVVIAKVMSYVRRRRWRPPPVKPPLLDERSRHRLLVLLARADAHKQAGDPSHHVLQKAVAHEPNLHEHDAAIWRS